MRFAGVAGVCGCFPSYVTRFRIPTAKIGEVARTIPAITRNTRSHMLGHQRRHDPILDVARRLAGDPPF